MFSAFSSHGGSRQMHIVLEQLQLFLSRRIPLCQLQEDVHEPTHLDKHLNIQERRALVLLCLLLRLGRLSHSPHKTVNGI